MLHTVYMVDSILMIVTNLITAYFAVFHMGEKIWKHWIRFDFAFIIILAVTCYIITDGADLTSQTNLLIEYAKGITYLFWGLSICRSIFHTEKRIKEQIDSKGEMNK